MSQVPTVELVEMLDVTLPNGEVYRLRQGPYGKGLAVIPQEAQAPRQSAVEGNGKRGRKPRPGTVALRQKLEKDAEIGNIRSTKRYLEFFMENDPTATLNVARQTVYRELRAVQ